MSSNAVPLSVTPPSPDEWPQDLIKTITGITKDSVATVTSTAHGFTGDDVGVTFICFKQVEGMTQINGLNALIQSVVDVDHFTVNINTTNFYTYASNGVVIVDTGLPPTQTAGFQTFNRPFQNVANVA